MGCVGSITGWKLIACINGILSPPTITIIEVSRIVFINVMELEMCVCVDVELESSYQFYDYASFIFLLIGRKNYSQGEEEWISIIWTVWLCKCVYLPIVFVVNSCIEIEYWSQQAGILWIPRVSGNVQKGRR